MKALIVDDDIFSIRGLEKGVAWGQDGIDELRQAVSAEAAKKILGAETIDVMICDIEMPNENGIELLQWIRERQIPVIVIFYSCHADFVYAQNAVKLQVFDYVLKPAPYKDIDSVIRRAVEESRKQRLEKEEEKFRGKRTLALKEKFMRAILDGTIPDTRRDVEKMAGMLGIELDPNARFYLILHDIKQWEEILRDWNKIDVEFAFKNISREIFVMTGVSSIIVIPVYAKYYLTMIEAGKGSVREEDLYSKCRHLNQAFKRLTGSGLNSCVGNGCQVEELMHSVGELLEISRREGSLEGAVTAEPGTVQEKKEAYSELVDQCYQEMLKGHRLQLMDYAAGIFEKMEAEKDYSFYRMEDIAQKYTQAAFAVLDIKNMDTGLLSDDPVYREKEKRALWGPAALKNFLEYVNDTVLRMLDRAGNERDVIFEIKAYIEKHLNEEISREELARMVFLNEDYLSRLFRRQEGIPLTQYITKKKIEKAKYLLQMPENTVTAAAEGIGISNFPYFSKMFKRETGMSPSEYRKKCQKSESN